MAFATFTSHRFAMAAMNELNVSFTSIKLVTLLVIFDCDETSFQDVKFDPQTGATLHIELARSNSRRKERPGNGI